MTPPKTAAVKLSAKACALTLCAAAAASPCHAAAAGLVECNPAPLMVFSAADLPALLGEKTDALRYVTPSAQGWQVQPLQIDEREGGVYLFQTILDDGGWFGGHTPPPGTLSPEDELVLAPTDPWSGPQTDLPAGRWYEITAQRAGQAAQSWGFVGVPASAMPASAEDRVSFDATHHAGGAKDVYWIGYGPKGESAFPTDLWLPQVSGGPSVDVLDRTGLQVDVTLRGARVHIRRDDRDIRRALGAYTDGPLRVLLDQRYQVMLLSWLPSPSAAVVMKLYPGCVEVPTSLNIPFDPDLALAQGGGRAWFSMSSALGASVVELASEASAVQVPVVWPDEPMGFGMVDSAVIDGAAASPISLSMRYPSAAWSALGVTSDLSLGPGPAAAVTPSPAEATPSEAPGPQGFDLAWNVHALQRLTRGTFDGSLTISMGRLDANPPSVRVSEVKAAAKP